MSDPGQEFVNQLVAKATAAALAPFSKMWSDIIGGVVGDRIEEWREAQRAYRSINARDIGKRAGEITFEKGVKPDPQTPPEHLEDILAAGAGRSEPELKEIFAKLMAAAVDPARRKGYRREFVNTLKQFDPLDAVVFPMLSEPGGMAPSRRENIASRLGIAAEEVTLSFENLVKLGVCPPWNGAYNHMNWPMLTNYGKGLLNMVR